MTSNSVNTMQVGATSNFHVGVKFVSSPKRGGVSQYLKGIFIDGNNEEISFTCFNRDLFGNIEKAFTKRKKLMVKSGWVQIDKFTGKPAVLLGRASSVTLHGKSRHTTEEYPLLTCESVYGNKDEYVSIAATCVSREEKMVNSGAGKELKLYSFTLKDDTGEVVLDQWNKASLVPGKKYQLTRVKNCGGSLKIDSVTRT